MDPWIYNIQFETKKEIDPEIKQKVMERFPTLESESRCATEKRERNRARETYARKLLNEEYAIKST